MKWGAHIRRMYKCAIVVFSKTKIAAARKPIVGKNALMNKEANNALYINK